VLFGRPPKLTLRQRREGIARRDAGEMLMAIGRSYAVNHHESAARDRVLFVLLSLFRVKIDPGVATFCGAIIGFVVVAWQTNQVFKI
jgi:hypothetical protein